MSAETAVAAPPLLQVSDLHVTFTRGGHTVQAVSGNDAASASVTLRGLGSRWPSATATFSA